MIQKKCDLCYSDKKKKLFSQDNFNVVRCKECGLAYIDPQPSLEEIKKFYVKRNENIKSGMICQSEVEKGHCIQRLDIIKRYFGSGKILDYGCGVSPFLSLARENGFEGYGFDLDEQAIEICKQNNINMLQKKGIKNNYFDVITLSQVLEHIPNPKAELKWVYDRLKKEGVVIIEVPNIKSLNAKLQGKHWFYYRVPYHLTYFSMDTLSKMVEEAGFTVVEKEWMGSFLLGIITQKFHKKGWTASDEYKINFIYKIFNPFIKFNYILAKKFRIGDHIRVIAQKGGGSETSLFL